AFSMDPERENNIVDLLDRCLNKGIILNADVVISVAGVPLIGISLKAAIASIETMLDYGVMEAWDERTRAWYAAELTKNAVVLADGEKLLFRTSGSIWYIQGIIRNWRPGIWYLTNKRLFLWNAEMLFETPLDRVKALMVETEPYLDIEPNILILHINVRPIRIRVSDVIGFRETIEKVSLKKLEMEIPSL
ncbi:MAG: gas vesicle protein, partial [Candidatus Methanoperedens sp.]|nr:gas vesicle protein [Candidatus Methanoperedens sp.]